jgi:hypothetical protein
MACPHTPWSMLVDLRAAEDQSQFTDSQRELFARLNNPQQRWTDQERARVVAAWMAMNGEAQG